VEKPGPYYNPQAQLSALTALLRKLPELDAPVRSSRDRRTPRQARQLDDQRVQQLIQEYQAGATVYELGERFGVSRQTVSRHLHRHGVPMRMQGLSPEQTEEAVQLYEAVRSLARIGERMGVDAGTVHARHGSEECGCGMRMGDLHLEAFEYQDRNP
jgi:DNA-directed RNA polymerase specialized sigma24 family protein